MEMLHYGMVLIPFAAGVQSRECPDAILVNKMSLMLLMCIIRTLQVLCICDFDGNDALF